MVDRNWRQLHTRDIPWCYPPELTIRVRYTRANSHIFTKDKIYLFNELEPRGKDCIAHGYDLVGRTKYPIDNNRGRVSQILSRQTPEGWEILDRWKLVYWERLGLIPPDNVPEEIRNKLNQAAG